MYNNSHKAFDEAKKFIPGGVNSPVRAFKSVNSTPVFFEKGQGSKMFDIDGKNEKNSIPDENDYCFAVGLGQNEGRIFQGTGKDIVNGKFVIPTEEASLEVPVTNLA